MYTLKISVDRVLGVCTANPPMKPGQYFSVSNGDIRIPQGSFVCAWALHSLLPLITPKERKILESSEDDWMWRVHHAQCPDPDGRVLFRIDQLEDSTPQELPKIEMETMQHESHEDERLSDVLVTVAEVNGECTSGMRIGDYFRLRSGRLYIPPERHFCLYALQAASPFLAAKQRHLEDGDWLNRANWISCPDPRGNVILKIEKVQDVETVPR